QYVAHSASHCCARRSTQDSDSTARTTRSVFRFDVRGRMFTFEVQDVSVPDCTGIATWNPDAAAPVPTEIVAVVGLPVVTRLCAGAVTVATCPPDRMMHRTSASDTYSTVAYSSPSVRGTDATAVY